MHMTHQTVPVIDITPLRSKTKQRKETIDQVGKACRDWGFFQVTGHEISADFLSRVWLKKIYGSMGG